MADQVGLESATMAETLKFTEILKLNGISEEVERVVIHEPPELKGEHMATATVYARIEFKDASKRSKNLFVKRFFPSEVQTAMLKKMRIMEKEATFYNNFLPEIASFSKKFHRYLERRSFDFVIFPISFRSST